MRKKIITIIILSVILIGLLFVARFFSSKVANDGVYTVVLDPGHGGSDPGAVTEEIYEKEINLAIALLIYDQLNDRENINVFLTRNSDEFVPLSNRAQSANKLNADLFVSIHANTLDDTSYSGIMTFHHPDKASSKKAAHIIQTALIEETGALDRNVRTEDYIVLKETQMPAVLVETGFMTNEKELSQLLDPDYQFKIATSITKGILTCAKY